ncbi:hypothetical protein Q0N48_05015 [Corynebacterium ureicelerivorans]|uniref:hypothetical protein n=1 Tax=Corynebacterium ureicelerivorans TaxID=401472 RepID=UPI00265014D8|nr:hypothetical protein [Corynebacterium ureicelerivorans]MDN8605362.1 hypothetical protein [Corynebacterium ureicelerivorans]
MGLNDILSNIDLNTVILHLDNFVDTWEGWGKVIKGLVSLTEIPGNLVGAIAG